MNIENHPIDSLAISPGSLIAGRYEVQQILGKGGMGAVVQVIDRALDNDLVALKILYPHLVNDKTIFARFRNEVLVVRQLSHPNIVRLYDFGATETGSFFISMEYIAGQNLSQLLRGPQEQRPDFQRTLRILYEIALGLEHAHQKQVIHRDVKPDNILVTPAGEVKITDFGLARSIDQDKGFTSTGEAVGTPYYMAPEQIQGERADGRADIYSFAILAYEMALGRRPFVSDDWYQLASMHLRDPMPPLSSRYNNIPKWFESFVHVAGAKKREDRFQSFGEILSILVDKLEVSPLPWKQLPSMLANNSIKKRKEKIATRSKQRLLQTMLRRFALGMAIVGTVALLSMVPQVRSFTSATLDGVTSLRE